MIYVAYVGPQFIRVPHLGQCPSTSVPLWPFFCFSSAFALKLVLFLRVLIIYMSPSSTPRLRRYLLPLRNVTAGHEVAADIVRENPNACVECHALDLASFSSVRSFARSSVGGQPVSAVIHNAGVMAPPYETTVDGHELTFQV